MNFSLPLSLHTYSQTTLLRSITLCVYPCSSLFPFLPRCLFPPCRCCQLRCTFMGVHKSSNISNKSHHFPIAPTDTCYWPLLSVYLFQCLVSFVFPVSGWLTGQHQVSVTQRHVLHYHFFWHTFWNKAFLTLAHICPISIGKHVVKTCHHNKCEELQQISADTVTEVIVPSFQVLIY